MRATFSSALHVLVMVVSGDGKVRALRGDPLMVDSLCGHITDFLRRFLNFVEEIVGECRVV